MDPDGSIRALIGGRNYAESQFNRAVAAKRQPGSSFKPFVYLAGLERGLTPDTVREDGPINVKGWQPENYSREYLGPVTLTRALALSLNTVAVRVGLEAGRARSCPRRIAWASPRSCSPTPPSRSALSEVSPLEMVSAFVPFANGGIGVQPHIIARVKSAAGALLYQRRPGNNGRVIDARLVPMMNTMMTETLVSGTARKGEIPGWQAGGKTGTSQDWRDAWFIGYTSRLVTGVWLGNDDSSPTKKASGGTLPVEIWSRFMKGAMGNEPPSPLPLGVWRAAPDYGSPFGDDDEEVGGNAPPVAALPPRDRPWRQEQATYGYRAAPAEMPAYRPPRQVRRDDLVPPADIPEDGYDRRRAPREGQSMFDRLFGG